MEGGREGEGEAQVCESECVCASDQEQSVEGRLQRERMKGQKDEWKTELRAEWMQN